MAGVAAIAVERNGQGDQHGEAARLWKGTQRALQLSANELPRTLLHGDAQQNNFVTIDTGAVVADVAPYFGHPEIDLALVDYFHPVPDDVFDAYRDIAPIEARFAQRRDLWRIFVDLACFTVEATPFCRYALARLAEHLLEHVGQAIEPVFFFLHLFDLVLARLLAGIGSVKRNQLRQQRLARAATGAGPRTLAERLNTQLTDDLRNRDVCAAGVMGAIASEAGRLPIIPVVFTARLGSNGRSRSRRPSW